MELVKTLNKQKTIVLARNAMCGNIRVDIKSAFPFRILKTFHSQHDNTRGGGVFKSTF